MASTFSPSLRIELIGDGDQSGIWGQTTNNNLGTLLEQAIAGVVTITMLDANYTLSNFNGVSDESRNQVIIATGTNSAQRDIIAPLVEKTYIVRNNTTGGNAIRIIGVTGTGVTIPNGITASVYCDGTNFFSALSGTSGNFTVNGAQSVTGALSVTGATTLSSALTYGGVTLANAVTGTGNMVLAASPALTGTPTAPTASPGTNTTQIATTAFVQNVAGGLGTMSTQNANNVSITGGTITGITDLAVADGGTGRSTLPANAVLVGNGTSGINSVSPGASGNLLVSNGTAWTSATLASSGVKLGLGITGETWQDVLGSRSSGATYTAPNYPIMVAVSQAETFQSHRLIIVVNGVTISNSGGGGNFYNGGQETSFIVPADATYSVTVTTAGFNTWAELR